MIPKALIQIIRNREYSWRCNLMKLFAKKKEEAKTELPPLKFPEFPKEQKVPSYEPGVTPGEATSIKEAVSPRLEIPIRKPVARIPTFSQPIGRERPAYEEREGIQKRGQTLFVKIERYKDATAKMDHIKDKIMEAERVLKKLDEMKRKEDEELIRWHQDLEVIKTKILSVDKSLFEG